MFSRKSKIYQEIESDLILELHKQGVTNLQLNEKFRVICILSIILSLLTPWYYEPFDHNNIYLYMICNKSIFPSGCSNYYSLHKSCSLSSSICSECEVNMRAGLIVLSLSLISIFFHLLSFLTTRRVIESKQGLIRISFVYLACIFYVLGCISWVVLSKYEPRRDEVSYGMMVVFSSFFINVFVTFHFYTFKSFLLDFYPGRKSPESSDHSRHEDQY